MKRDGILQKLKEREADLRAQGVAYAALFGSIARGDDRPPDDISTAQKFIKDISFGAFKASQLHFYAVMRPRKSPFTIAHAVS